MGLIQMKSNQQMVVEEEKAIQDLISFEEEKTITRITDSLSSYLHSAFEDAKKEKRAVENQILDNMRAIKGEYDSAKMADINKLGGSTIYMMLTETKARNCEAWVKDILFQPNNIPWDIEPTPMPDLPGDLETTIIEDFMQQTVDTVITMSMQSGAPVDQNLLSKRLKAAIPEIKAGAKQAIKNYAKEKAEEMKDQINDQLVEGGWYDAFDEIIPDAILKTGILKGPTLRIENQRKVDIDDEGNPTLTVEPTKIPTYERRPPLDIYPGPGATGFDNAYLFDKLAYSPSQIQGFIGLPGFKEKEIRLVLQECEGGTLREWTSIDTERAEMEEKPVEMIRDWEEVDVLEFWGPVQGKTLHEWDEGLKKKAPDADKFYEINAYLVGNHVIKAILNPDPMGKKPYSKVSFIEKAGSFWGVGLPEVIADLQAACNACARALVNNVGMASGPQVVINEEMLADFEKGDFVPWKRWWVNDNDASAPGRKAIEFYQPTLIAQQLISVFEFFMKQADESSGVPAYAHGDPQVGGGGNTASGLSMLMTMAARGIKLFVKNIDRKAIEDSIRRQYYWNMERKKFAGLVGDQKIVAKGSVSLIAKEQQATRMTELLSISTQTQVLQPQETRKLFKKVLKTHEIDPKEIMDDSPIPLSTMAGYQPNAIPSLAKPATLNAAGEPAQGTDFQTVLGRGGPASSPAPAR
jgi:hypothetical protein